MNGPSMQGDLGLNIREAHAFNTNDGYSLDVFVVDGWQGVRASVDVAHSTHHLAECGGLYRTPHLTPWRSSWVGGSSTCRRLQPPRSGLLTTQDGSSCLQKSPCLQ